MTLEEMTQFLSTGNGAKATAHRLTTLARPSPTDAEWELGYMKLINKVAKAPNATVALAALLVYARPADAVRRMRRDGLLRSSRYRFASSFPRQTVRVLLEAKGTIGLSEDDAAYLTSVDALCSIAGQIRALRDALIARMRARRGSVLHTLLSMLNRIGSGRWVAIEELSTDELEHYTFEEIADAVSSLVAIYREQFNLQVADLLRIDLRADETQGIYRSLLVDAAKLNAFCRVELLIDAMPYRATVRGRDVVVASIDPALEQACRLGYIQFSNQQTLHHGHLTELLSSPGAARFSDVIDKAYTKGLNRWVSFQGEPPRIRVEFLLGPPFFSWLRDDALYPEEVVQLRTLATDRFQKVVEHFPVTPRLSTLDLFKVGRLFELISRLHYLKASEIEDANQHRIVTLKSGVVGLSKPDLATLLGLLLTPEKAEEVLPLLSLTPDRRWVDLQYTPILELDGVLAFMPSLIMHTNLVRNVVCANQLHDRGGKHDDPMESRLHDTLAAAGFRVARGQKITFDGQKLEIDIVARRGDHLFVFECKHSYHPCSVAEARTSYEHLEKAAEQLDKRKSSLATSANQLKLYKLLGWPFSDVARVHTGIVIGNRVFHGWRCSNHPVRQAHELLHMISSGVMGDRRETFHLWRGSEFQTADLLDYLSDNSFVDAQLAALTPIEEETRVGSRPLRVSTYAMEPRKLRNAIASRYRMLSAPDGTGVEAALDH